MPEVVVPEVVVPEVVVPEVVPEDLAAVDPMVALADTTWADVAASPEPEPVHTTPELEPLPTMLDPESGDTVEISDEYTDADAAAEADFWNQLAPASAMPDESLTPPSPHLSAPEPATAPTGDQGPVTVAAGGSGPGFVEDLDLVGPLGVLAAALHRAGVPDAARVLRIMRIELADAGWTLSLTGKA